MKDFPNIIFVMADDMGYGDLGCYGATKIPTPNMDRLAEKGLRFTDAHSPSALCTPTRYGVMTGRYCWRTRLKTGVVYGYDEPLIEADRLTVASLLKKKGYMTAGFGKWHLGLKWQTGENGGVDYSKSFTGGPTDLGFDYYFGITASLDMPPYCFLENDRTVGIPDREKDVYHDQQRQGLMVQDWKDEEVGPVITEKAVQFIKNHYNQNKNQPFFLYMATSAPHRPCVPPSFIKGKSQAGPRGDMVVEVDWTVGRLMDTLDSLGLSENTLFILTSDNGARNTCYNGLDYGHKPNGFLRGQKTDIWDGGHREPFIARWPGKIKGGATSSEIICLTDMLATFAAIIGEDLPEDAGEDSYNILPALLGEELKKPIREATVHHSSFGHFAIRRGPWKLITKLGSGGETWPREVIPVPGKTEGQLYNLMTDPGEENNVWDDYLEIVDKLSRLLEKYQREGRSIKR